MLPKGEFQTVTPCFRNEIQDFSHRKHFMKNELIIADSSDSRDLDQIIKDAMEFFVTYSDGELKVEEVKNDDNVTKINYDITMGGYELGSYGIRKFNNLSWVYGTGVAEPRFSSIIEANIENRKNGSQ